MGLPVHETTVDLNENRCQYPIYNLPNHIYIVYGFIAINYMQCGLQQSRLTPPTPTEGPKALAEFGEEAQEHDGRTCDATQP
jgi:hypothetical protein